MRHASIQTKMNIYGKAMTDSKRHAHSKVVETVLNSRKNDQKVDQESRFLLLGVNGSVLVRSESVQPIGRIGCGGWI